MTELAHQLGLVPLLWLAALRLYGQPRPPMWWWVASAFALSWVADSVAHLADPALVSAVYPVSQAGLIAAALVPHREAMIFAAVLVGGGLLALGMREGSPGVFLRTVAWLGLVGFVMAHPSPLRATIITAFGVGWLAWVVVRIAPSWTSWGVYQGVRAVSLGLFCWASLQPRMLRLA